MKRPRTRKHNAALLILIVSVVILTALANPALAQEPTPTPTQVQAATEAPASDADTATSATSSNVLAFLRSAEFYKLASAILFTALAMWAILFLYTTYIQTRYLAAAVELAQQGIATEPSGTNEAFPGTAGPQGAKIKGKGTVTVGTESEQYELVGVDPAIDEKKVKWTVDPEDMAVVGTVEGPATKLTAKKSGTFTLKATFPDNTAVPFPVKAVAPQTSNKISLPVFGRAYGTIAIAVVVLAIVLILGLATILPEGSIATLLGTLIAYIFSRNPPGQSGGNAGGNPPNNEEV